MADFVMTANFLLWYFFQIAFLSTMLIDEHESCYIKGLRICKEHEKRGLLPMIFDTVSDWAKTNGALRIVGTLTDPNQGIWRSGRKLTTMVVFYYCSFHYMNTRLFSQSFVSFW